MGCAELVLLHCKGLDLKVKGVEGDGGGDVVALLLLAHVGAPKRCKPQVQAVVFIAEFASRSSHSHVEGAQVKFVRCIDKNERHGEIFRIEGEGGVTAVTSTCSTNFGVFGIQIDVLDNLILFIADLQPHSSHQTGS